MEIEVDWDACEANGLCEGIAPDIFQVDDDDQLQLLQPNPPEADRSRVDQAVASCPKAALRLKN